MSKGVWQIPCSKTKVRTQERQRRLSTKSDTILVISIFGFGHPKSLFWALENGPFLPKVPNLEKKGLWVPKTKNEGIYFVRLPLLGGFK